MEPSAGFQHVGHNLQLITVRQQGVNAQSVVRSVPADHAVKTKVFPTTVVPLHR
jgi:hypothetical protein